MKALLVISNHSPEKWGDDQKKGWDKIEYIPFPNIPSSADMAEVRDVCMPVIQQAKKWLADNNGKINLQGEFSATFIMQQEIDPAMDSFVFPTTERIVEETVRPDGTVAKTANFKFVRWR